MYTSESYHVETDGEHFWPDPEYIQPDEKLSSDSLLLLSGLRGIILPQV